MLAIIKIKVCLVKLCMLTYVGHIACISQHGVTYAHHSKLQRYAVTKGNSQSFIALAERLHWMVKRLWNAIKYDRNNPLFTRGLEET